MIRPIQFLFLAVLLSCKAFAGVWPQGKGNGYFQVAFTYLRYTELIDDFSLMGGYEVHELKRRITDHTLNGYLEYGISERFTFMASVPYKFMSTGDELLKAPTDIYPGDTVESGGLSALGNINLGGKYLLYRGKWLWSFQFISGSRTATYDHPTGLRTGYDAWYFTPRVLLGRSWGNTYLSSSLGFRYKTNQYANDLISDNEVGYGWERKSGEKTWFIFTIGAEIPVTEGEYNDRNSIHTGTYRDEEGFVDPGLKINHYLTENLSINFSTIGALWAWHGGNEMTVTGGISWDW